MHARRGSFLGGVVSVLLLLGLVFLIVAWWQQWIWFGSREVATGEREVTVTIDQEKMRRDTRRAADEVRHETAVMRERIDVAANLKSVEGRADDIDPAGRHFELRSDDGRSFTFITDENTQWRMSNETVNAQMLNDGDRIAVLYDVEEHPLRAQRVTFINASVGMPERPELTD